jgi:MFS family permease
MGYLGIGVAAAAISFLPMFLAIPVGSLTDRWGVRPMVIAGTIISGLSYLALWSAPGVAILIASQLVAGLANLLIVLGAQSYVGSLGNGRAAERNFGTYTIYASIGQILGPLLGGIVISLIGFGGAFASAASLSTLCLAAAMILLPKQTATPATAARRPLPARTWKYLHHKTIRLAILSSCLMSVPEILRTSFLPIYLGEVVRLDPVWVGYVLSLFSVAGLVAKTVLPRVVERFGRQTLMLTITIGCAATLAVIPLSASVWTIGIITLLMGATFGLGRPLSMAMAATSASPGDLGMVVGLRLSGNRLADFGLPLAFGSAASVAGIGASFVVGAGLMVLGAGYLLRPMLEEVRLRRNGQAPDFGS